MLFLLDLDGVLADFAAGVAALFDKPVPGPESRGQELPQALGITSGQMWSRIDDVGRRFWEELPMTAEANELVALLRSEGEIVIASAPSMSPSSAAGKLRWLQKRFGKNFREFMIGSRKDLLAGPERLLIDDSPKHTDAFIAQGGVAVLYPTWTNGERQDDTDPVAVVRDVIAGMKAGG